MGALAAPLLAGGGGYLLGSALSKKNDSNISGQQYVPPQIEQVPALMGAQRQLLDRLSGYIGSNLGQAGWVPPSYLGPEGYAPLQQEAFGLSAYTQPAVTQGLNLAGPALQQAAQMFRPESITESMRPVREYTTRMFEEDIAPAIMSAAGMEGTSRSSGVLDRLAKAGTDLSLGMSAQFAPLQLQARQSDLARALSLPGAVSQAAMLPTSAATGLANIGAMQRQIPEEQRQYELQRFIAQDPSQNPWLSHLGVALGTPAFTNVGFPGMMTQGFREPSLMESLLPAAGTFGGMALGGYLSRG